jgi:putative toxin-antitoxin system antitoxin component (TIGR02293 family)
MPKTTKAVRTRTMAISSTETEPQKLNVVQTVKASYASKLTLPNRIKQAPGSLRAHRMHAKGLLLKLEPAWAASATAKGKELTEIIEEIKTGYPVQRFEALKDSLGVSEQYLASVCGISLASLHRRKKSGSLTPDESEKVHRFEKLVKTAVEVLEDKDAVIVWFNTPQIVLGGKKPIDFADTIPGSEEVERVLRRMEQGIIL